MVTAARDARYSRQELFAGLGPEGQRRLRAAHVAVLGCGALGSAAAEALARAGVGALTLADRDFVELSNLQRQSLYDEEDARRGLPKAMAAEARLRRVNADVRVAGRVLDVGPAEALELAGAADLVLDGSDNFELRYLLNDACVKLGRPWIYAACVGAYGLVLAVRPGTTPCLRCVLGDRPPAGSSPTCDTAGVIGPIVQVVAALQVAEALKLLAGRDEALLGGLVSLDVWNGTFDVMDLRGRAPHCPACVERRFEYLDAPAGAAAVLCGRDAVQLRAAPGTRLDLETLETRLRALGPVTRNEYLLRFASGGAELAVFADGRAIVKGVADAAEARSLYARYVGS
jgi:adenylyltransferase/sulfurtransferase